MRAPYVSSLGYSFAQPIMPGWAGGNGYGPSAKKAAAITGDFFEHLSLSNRQIAIPGWATGSDFAR
jgi:hypothetical protein